MIFGKKENRITASTCPGGNGRNKPIGTRFNERITGKTGHFATHVAIIHINIDPASISGNIEVDIPVVAYAKML